MFNLTEWVRKSGLKPATESLLRREDLDTNAYFQRVSNMIGKHTVKEYQCKYIFMILPCFENECIHPICKKGPIASKFDEKTWFPGGPHISYLPIPIKGDKNPGHFLTPEMNNKYVMEKNHNKQSIFMDLPADVMKEPPSEILKKSFLTKKCQIDVGQLSDVTLLPPGEVQMYISDMTDISSRRKEGAKRAMETRKKKGNDALAVSTEPRVSEAELFC